MKKLFLSIFVLGLMLSGNAYAFVLSNCYLSEREYKIDNITTKESAINTAFNSEIYTEYYFNIDKANNTVTKIVNYQENKKPDYGTDYSFLAAEINYSDTKYIKALGLEREKFFSSGPGYTINLVDNTVKEVYVITDTTHGGSVGTVYHKEYSLYQCESSSGSSSSSDIASSGSGFFINNKGYFVTNNHVVKGCKQSKITFKEEEVDAELIATDETLDLALLRVKVKPKDYLNISDEPPEKMQKVFVAGYPFGKGLSDDLKFTQGIISAVKGFADNSNQIQLDAAINAGNSGGPIVNEDGDLVAVAVSGLDKSKAEGIGFGIKASSVINFLEVNNAKYSSSSLINFGMSNKKLNKLMEASTVYTFCN